MLSVDPALKANLKIKKSKSIVSSPGDPYVHITMWPTKLEYQELHFQHFHSLHSMDTSIQENCDR